jgi:hypothetical protein
MASARILLLTCAAVLPAILVHPVSAAPAAPEECDRARSEQTALSSSGAVDDLAKGPEWGRANLAPDRLKRIARWIELEEVLLFRCPRPKPAAGPETAARADEGPAGPAAAPPSAAPKAKAKPKPKPKPTDGTTETAGEEAAQAVKPKPTAKKKPKPDDAYRPPAPFTGEEVQHVAPGLAVPGTGGTGLVP